MKFVKIDLRNRMGDEWLNDSLIVYNERSIFASVSNERILKRFQDMIFKIWIPVEISCLG